MSLNCLVAPAAAATISRVCEEESRCAREDASAWILLAAGLSVPRRAGRSRSGGGAGPAKAKATTPEIPFDSVPNFFKLPAGLYMGEGTGVATNSQGPRVRLRAQRRDAPVRVRSERRLRQGIRRGQLRLLVRARGARRQGRQRVGRRRGHQRHPEVQSRRQAADGPRQASRSARSARADAGRRPVLGRQPAVHVPSADRHRLGSAGQHLRVGRLRRFARREVRQERPLRQGRRHARQRPAAIQHAARDLGRREGHGLRRRSRQPPHRRARQRL